MYVSDIHLDTGKTTKKKQAIIFTGRVVSNDTAIAN
jgi:hypothetical protein